MPTSTITLTDGTSVTIDCTASAPDPSLPIVVLLHGMGGNSLDMTAPAANYPGLSFNRSAMFPFYKDEGLHFVPSVLPAARFYLDPPAGPLTSWNTALKAAGFTTITYTQSGPLIANDVLQLTLLVTQVLTTGSFAGVPLLGFRVAFVAHSRGGLVARSFLTGAGAGFLARFTSLITLHSPNSGSGVASIAGTVATLLTRAATAFTGAGLPAGAVLATALAGMVLNPSRAELIPGNPTLAAIAAAEPVAGVTYHTFGGISTDFARLWADIYTPDSTIPFFFPLVPFPLFHWGSTPVVVGVPLNIATFVPAVLAAPTPLITELMAVATALAVATPDIAPGAGDLLVSDARARLPFSASHTTNLLNHLEALSDPTLQAQVVAILLRLRTPVSAGTARATLSPYPARPNVSTQYRVTAVDTVTGAAINQGMVQILDNGQLVRTVPVGSSFNFSFTSHKVTRCTFDPRTHERDCERVDVWPTVRAEIGTPYGTVRVNTGL
ncbi:MAG: hypothetical protein QM778_14725 [Myxococcales bacterium]